MAADLLSIDVSGDTLLATLERAAAKLENPTDMMQMIGATLEANVRKRFATQTDPEGNRWAALAPATLARKKSSSILVELGYGKTSLSSYASGNYAEVGFGERYMGFHETGTRKMPRRGLLTADPLTGRLGAEDEQDVLEVVTSYLNGLGLD